MKHCAVEVYLKKAIFIIAATSLCLGVNAEAEPVEGNKEADSGKVLAIVEAFNTSQKLWLYKKNYTDDDTIADELNGIVMTGFDPKQECTYIKKYNITQKDFNFWWVTLVMGDMVQSHYYGNFSSEDSANLGSMTVTDLSASDEDKEPFVKMTLKHKEENCTVFFVESLENGETACEMYVKNQAVSRGPTDSCEEYYKKYCEDKTTVYDTTCEAKVQSAKEKFEEITASRSP